MGGVSKSDFQPNPTVNGHTIIKLFNLKSKAIMKHSDNVTSFIVTTV